MANLLLELRTEELPPKLLSRLGESFSKGIETGLRNAGLLTEDSQTTAFAAPRRLGVHITQVAAMQSDQLVERKGPNKTAAFDAAGQPTPALKGFARSCGVDIDQLSTTVDAKGIEIFLFRAQEKGAPLQTILQPLLNEVLQKLPVHKVMRWGAGDVAFVRPVHGLMALLGQDILAIEALGHPATRMTLGHRFLSEGEITIPSADDYETRMHNQGKVVTRFSQRRAMIESGLQAKLNGDRLMAGDELLDEVTALVEWPAVYEGHFDQAFLSVPAECLTLSMKSHQKYFPVGKPDGTLSSRFLLVSNIETADPHNIINGNERVLRARLADAQFFFEQDQKRSLASRNALLDTVVYHNKLGSVGDRVRRLMALAKYIAESLGSDSVEALRAAELTKADLVTDMVGEFPELQGIMGAYYARHDGESETVATAIREHYLPRFAGDALPASPAGIAVALAEKLDTLVGIYGIGQIPTGDKDPYALRRQALGVIRILIEHHLPLSLKALLSATEAGFQSGALNADTQEKLHGFMLERARHYLREQGHRPESIEAVLANCNDQINTVPQRLNAVKEFLALDAAESLAAANKRIHNLLKKVESTEALSIEPSLFESEAESKLFAAIEKLSAPVQEAMTRGAYVDALGLLAGVRSEVDQFFKDVMVMAENPKLRQNRLALLNALNQLMNQVADLSHLSLN